MTSKTQEVSTVAAVRVGENIPEAVRKIFDLVGAPVLEDGNTVTIKLNLCFFRTYDTGATTDPRVLEALIQFLRTLARDLDIVLVESDATSARADLLFKWLGFADLAQRLKVRTLNLSNDKRVKVALPPRVSLRRSGCPRLSWMQTTQYLWLS